MKQACIALVLAWALAATTQAQRAERGHFTYTGDLLIGRGLDARVVGHAEQAPVSRVHFRRAFDTRVDVTLMHEGIVFRATGQSAGLRFHLHTWTMAHARGFQVHVPPGARLRVLEGSTERVVRFEDTHLGEATLGSPHVLPGWLRDAIAQETQRWTQCNAVTLYAAPREEGEPLEVPEGMTLHTQPARDGFIEAWVRFDARWVRGYARAVQCVFERMDERLGISGEGSLGAFEPPPHVLLPRGLQLVSPAHPTRVVLRVRRPVDAISWGPGWTSANDEGALRVDLPCGFGEEMGLLRFAPSQLVPLGAP